MRGTGRAPALWACALAGAMAASARAEELPPGVLPAPTEPAVRPPKPKIALELTGKLAVGFLSSGAGVSAASAVPPALAGIRYGRFTAQLGFGFQRSSSQVMYTSGRTPTMNETGLTIFTCDPTITLELYRSDDRKAALYFLAAALLGGYLQSSQSMGTGSGTAASSQNFVYGYQFAIGARVAINKNFALGIEAGPVSLSYTLSPDLRVGNSSEGITTANGSTVIYSALTGSFTLGGD